LRFSIMRIAPCVRRSGTGSPSGRRR
jgi:hypothetical protein